MATAAGTPTLYERSDIHKSCKSLETLLSVLNDYCEAADAVVSLQKQLARALRDSASLKATSDTAANALNGTASIFEALSDIDSKFAKIVDKEYDSLSNEVKKWFKKLAKEEKVHDDKISVANGRIKQAGQIYEKKSRKNTREADEEHGRYINLISSLGPEISQEKFNHTLAVTQKHCSMTFSVAACVSRIADGEWLRNCEGIRRLAPIIGPLGQWRALCEGGWNGAVPPDLPDAVDTSERSPDQPAVPNTSGDASYKQRPRRSSNNFSDKREITELHSAPPEKEQSTPSRSPLGPRQYSNGPYGNANRPIPPSSFDPPRALVDPNTGSVRSLSAFPSPPTHVPPPRPQQLSHGSSASHVTFPTTPRVTDARVSNDTVEDHSPASHLPIPNHSGSNSPSPRLHQDFVTESRNSEGPAVGGATNVHFDESLAEVRRPLLVQPPTLTTPATPSQTETPPSPQQMKTSPTTPVNKTENEYRSGHIADAGGSAESSGSKSRPVERSNTRASTGSIVAAMRNRYSLDSGPRSPPPKEVPMRPPVSVTDLATRYQPTDGPSSPRVRTASPPSSRALPSTDTFAHARQAEASFRDAQAAQTRSPETYTRSPDPPRSEPPLDEEAVRRQRRLEDLEIREKEQALRARELELELKARELERQRDTLGMGIPLPSDGRDTRDVGYAGVGATGRPAGELERQRDNLMLRERQRYDSTPRPAQYLHSLSVPSPSIPSSSRTPSDRSTSPTATSGQLNSLHPPHCTCETCKSASAKGPKKGGWMRRLSMPIVNGLDHSKKTGGHTTKGHVGVLSLDGKKMNASTTMLAVREDGGMGTRISYDAGSGISNRSVSNLNLGRR